MKPIRALVLASLVLLGCAGRSVHTHTIDWVELRTRDVRLQTDLTEPDARVFVEAYQRMRDAIADNELPCGFEQMSEPVTVTAIYYSWHSIVGWGLDGFHAINPHEVIELDTLLVINASAETKNAAIFLHELTHRLVSLCFPNAPLWLNEGLASFYESSRLVGDELRIGYPNAMFVDDRNGQGRTEGGDVIDLYSLDRAPTLAELRAMDWENFYDDPANYLAAWVAVHLLALGDSTLEARFNRYLTELGQGVEEDLAWRRSFATVDMEARYQAHLVDRYVWGSRTVSIPPVEVERVRLMTSEEVALRLAEFYDWEDRRGAQSAREYIGVARRESPTSVMPMLYLAALSDARGDQDEARQWLDRALQTDPSDPRVLASALRWHMLRRPLAELESQEARLSDWAESLEESGRSAFQLAAAADWFRVTGDAERSLGLARSAIERDRHLWLAHESLGLALLDTGDHGEAVAELELAVKQSEHAGDEVRTRLLAELESARMLVETAPGP